MIGRLWWRREAAWGLELDGELQRPAASVVLRGATVRTVVNLSGHAELPSAPAAVVEFEAESVETTSPSGVTTTSPTRDTDPAPDFPADERPTKSDRPVPANDNSTENT